MLGFADGAAAERNRRARRLRPWIATFKLDRATAAALGKFQQPKRYAQFHREAAEESATAAWRWPDIRELCAEGVLEPA
jgi:hypothetical protein